VVVEGSVLQREKWSKRLTVMLKMPEKVIETVEQGALAQVLGVLVGAYMVVSVEAGK
jgi:hypothetical protein